MRSIKRDCSSFAILGFDCWLAWGVMESVKATQIGGLQTPKSSTPFEVIHSPLYVSMFLLVSRAYNSFKIK